MIMRNGIVERYKFSYHQTLLKLTVLPLKGTATIEFSGKILREGYPKLINKDTIHECFDRINRLGFFSINADDVIEYGEVVQCDVTADVEGVLTNKLITFVAQHLNYPQWTITPYDNCNLTVQKPRTTARAKRRMTIYDKGKEMQAKKDNRDFIDDLANKDMVRNYFRGKTRLELNLTSKEAIRTDLGIANCDLRSVLQSERNPLRDNFLQAVKLVNKEKKAESARDFERAVVLAYYDNDISRIKEQFRPYYTRVSGLNKIIAQYRQLSSKLQPADYGWVISIFDNAS